MGNNYHGGILASGLEIIASFFERLPDVNANIFQSTKYIQCDFSRLDHNSAKYQDSLKYVYILNNDINLSPFL